MEQKNNFFIATWIIVLIEIKSYKIVHPQENFSYSVISTLTTDRHHYQDNSIVPTFIKHRKSIYVLQCNAREKCHARLTKSNERANIDSSVDQVTSINRRFSYVVVSVSCTVNICPFCDTTN